MKNIVFIKLSLILILSLFLIPCHGFLYYNEVSARSSAMGGAFYSLDDDPSVLYYNPAGIAGLKQSCFLFTYLVKSESNKEFGEENRFVSGAFVVFKTKLLNLGFGYIKPLSHGEKNHIYTYESSYWSKEVEYNKYIFTFAKQLEKMPLRIGININLHEINGTRNWTIYDSVWGGIVETVDLNLKSDVLTCDIGLQYDLFNFLTLGVSIKQGRGFYYDVDMQYVSIYDCYPSGYIIEDIIPWEYNLGLKFNYKSMIFSAFTNQAEWSSTSEYETYYYNLLEEECLSNSYPTDNLVNWGAGLEIKPFENELCVRSGYKNQTADDYKLTFTSYGLGLIVKNIYFDVSYTEIKYELKSGNIKMRREYNSNYSIGYKF
ncbi:hypothetical protein KAU33_05375 [Candidatus Dependentiae bacterium]|nr:hypothetical protein [Candidatus Dependentiae bacterium]